MGERWGAESLLSFSRTSQERHCKLLGPARQQGLRAHRCSTASELMVRSSSARKAGTCTANTLPLSVPR